MKVASPSKNVNLLFKTRKTVVYQFGCRAGGGPISAILERHPANDNGENTLSLKNAIRVETMSMSFRLLRVLAQIPISSEIIFCTL